jgi:3-dehydroquinate synthase
LNHIASGDPFEMGSARPLDFGHWAAHKLEGMSNYRIRHGEAVAIGITLDCIYSRRAGWFSAAETERVVKLFLALGFELWAPELDIAKSPSQNKRLVLDGLEEFREHLGGELTVTMLKGIGQGFEVHHIDEGVADASFCEMKERFGQLREMETRSPEQAQAPQLCGASA